MRRSLQRTRKPDVFLPPPPPRNIRSEGGLPVAVTVRYNTEIKTNNYNLVNSIAELLKYKL
jgi:hypothetical protein